MKLPKISEIIQDISFPENKISNSDKLYIFGRNPELSLAEIIARYNVNFNQSALITKDLTASGVIIENEKHISIKNCGAVLKKCKIIAIFLKNTPISEIKPVLESHINGEYIIDKSNWGISSYNDSDDSSYKAILNRQTLHEIAKKGFKNIGIKKAYFIPPMEGNTLTPQKLLRKKIIDEGIEFILWYRKKDVILCQTEEVIDIDSFAKRDKERPHKRLLLLLGLALARTMVNLVSIEKNNHNLPIYDPFCGMGSIVQEAYILGLQAMGSDIDKSCVFRSKENLNWVSQTLGKKFRTKYGNFPSDKIFEMDITAPNFPLLQEFNGSIVAEPNLLTPLKSYPLIFEAKKMISQFEENYNRYLKEINQILPTGGICVLIFPQIHTAENIRLSLDIERMLKIYNFKICEIKVNNAVFPASFIHAWKNPIIERQILVLKKKN